MDLSFTGVKLKFTGVQPHSQPYLQRRFSSLDSQSFVPHAAPQLYLQWVFTTFNYETTIIEPLLVSSLFPRALAIYDTRVTESIKLFCGHDSELVHW